SLIPPLSHAYSPSLHDALPIYIFRMLTRYAERRGFGIEQLEVSGSEAGGFKEVVFAVKGDGAYSVFKWEAGTHRVQRVPETESQDRKSTRLNSSHDQISYAVFC